MKGSKNNEFEFEREKGEIEKEIDGEINGGREREREQARERERDRTREPQRELITSSNCKKNNGKNS